MEAHDAPGRVNDSGRLDAGSRVEAPFSGTVGHVNGMQVVVGRAKVKGLSIIGQNGLAGLTVTGVVSPTQGTVSGIESSNAVLTTDEKSLFVCGKSRVANGGCSQKHRPTRRAIGLDRVYCGASVSASHKEDVPRRINYGLGVRVLVSQGACVPKFVRPPRSCGTPVPVKATPILPSGLMVAVPASVPRFAPPTVTVGAASVGL